MQLLINPGEYNFKGDVKLPGDKTTSLQVLFFSCLSSGSTFIKGINDGDDVAKAIVNLKLLGYKINKAANDIKVSGDSYQETFAEQIHMINCGNSFALANLTIGFVSTIECKVTFFGSRALSNLPIKQMLNLLLENKIKNTSYNFCMPITIFGQKVSKINATLKNFCQDTYSSLILSALRCPEESEIYMPQNINDKCISILNHFGYKYSVSEHDSLKCLKIRGFQKVSAKDIEIFGDSSVAAFLVVAALILPGSSITLSSVYISNGRAEYLNVLKKMGGNIQIVNQRKRHGETIADIQVEYSKLYAVNINKTTASTIVDEYVAVAIAAAFAEGITLLQGIDELRFKESNRVISICENLKLFDIKAEHDHNFIEIHGIGDRIINKQVEVNTHGDSHITIAFIIVAMLNKNQTLFNDYQPINTIYPRLIEQLKSIGVSLAIGHSARFTKKIINA
jgi:3-phosphoshikimate 1-carboxyvinyltransferase